MNNSPITGILPELLTKSFIVNSSHLNDKNELNVCTILETITSLKDEAILQITGSLDYSKIAVAHFYLDFIEQAALNDLVSFQVGINPDLEDFVEISITGYKKKGKSKIPVMNGSFVFTIERGGSDSIS